MTAVDTRSQKERVLGKSKRTNEKGLQSQVHTTSNCSLYQNRLATRNPMS